MIPIIKKICPVGLKNNPNRKLKSIDYITIHNTGNYDASATAASHASYLFTGSAGRQVSWHYTIDKNSIYQSFEDLSECWHAGDGNDGPGNYTSIGIEICVNDKNGFESACNNAAELVADLLLKYNLPVDRVVQHSKWSGKNCPAEIRSGAWGITWSDFIEKVKSFTQDCILTPIYGKPQATAEQMAGYLLSKNPAPKILCMAQELAELFIEEGKTENIRGDIAWCQSLKETGYFKFGNIVNPEQNNYAGIGALNDNANGQCAAFSTPREGVRAQIQHLKAYANNEQLNNVCIDQRFNLVKRGAAPYVEWLGKADNPNGAGWAVPGNGYGESIIKILAEVMSFKAEKKPENIFEDNSLPKLEKWQRDGLDALLKDGLIADEAYWLSGNATKPDIVGLIGKVYKNSLK